MATIHPAQPDPDTAPSERKLFDCLCEGLPDEWTVIHGRRFLIPAEGDRRPVEGEVDFLVLDPARGYLRPDHSISGHSVSTGRKARGAPPAR